MLYIARRRLSVGVAAGGLFNGDILRPDALETLENKGLIYPVHAPALAEVWPCRVDELFLAGFNCLDELIMAPNLTGALLTWQQEAIKLLSPGPFQSCNCRNRRS